MKITIERFVTPAVADQLLADHREVFDPLDELAAEQQSLPNELFVDFLARDDVLLFIGWDEQRPVSLLMATNNLELIPWIQPLFYRKRYPDQAERAAIIYVPTLQIAAAYQGTHIAEAMCEAFTLWLALRRGVVAFDSCLWDIENLGVPQFIAKYALRHVEGITEEIDSQHYYGYEVLSLKSLDLRDTRSHGVDIDIAEPTFAPVQTEATHE